MPDLKKVIKGIECCLSGGNADACGPCPYKDECANAVGKYSSPLRRDALSLLKAQEPITGETSDGYHTFNELYHHRAVLFSVIVANYPDRAWKSKKHHDGTMYDNMFIVGIDTPDGQATYHYDVDPYWDMFKCRVLDYAPEWDGHTPTQAIERIGKLKAQEPHVITKDDFSRCDDFGYIPAVFEPIDMKNFLNWEWSLITPNALSRNDGRYWSGLPSEEQREAVKWE